MIADISLFGQSIFLIIIIFAILFAIFYVIRQFFLWYWRVNEIVSLLTDIKEELSILNGTSGKKKKTEIVCVHCGKESQIEQKIFDSGEFYCPKCNKLNSYEPQKEEKYYDVICKSCNSTVEINEEEHKNKKFACPDCGKDNVIE